ncbi:hypothetical protein PUT24_04065 [Streptomyces sp. SP17KL33]|nr:hypothetical protein [Streptomyces sp. SP17KL33]
MATIGKGRTVAIDTAAAEAVPGVRLVLTRFTEDELRGPGFLMGGGFAFQSLQPLLSDVVAYRGQPIALIVADTLVAATEAAELVGHATRPSRSPSGSTKKAPPPSSRKKPCPGFPTSRWATPRARTRRARCRSTRPICTRPSTRSR